MWTCTNCREEIEDSFDACWNCGTSSDNVEDPTFAAQRDELQESNQLPSDSIPEGIVLTTTPSLDSHRVTRYLGLAFGEAIMASNVLGDLNAGLTNILGGRSLEYEPMVKHARNIAVAEMARHAKQLGGNAVLSIQVNYQTIRGSMTLVTCTGTAVVVEGPQARVAEHDRDSSGLQPPASSQL